MLKSRQYVRSSVARPGSSKVNSAWAELKNARDDVTQVRITIRVAGDRLRVHTGVSLSPSDWDSSRKRVSARHPDADNLNRTIELCRQRVMEAYSNALSNSNRSAITVGIVRIEYDQLSEGNLSSTIDRYRDHLVRRHRSPVKLSTLTAHIENFCLMSGQDIPHLTGLDENFIESFRDYLHDKLDLVDSSVWSLFKELKAMLTWAEDHGRDVHPYIRQVSMSDFTLSRSASVVLTQREFNVLNALNVRDDDTLRAAQLMAIIQVNTGLRYGDLVRLALGELEPDANGILRFQTAKTRQDLSVPISEDALLPIAEIRRSGTLSNGTYNRALKRLIKRGDIDRTIPRNRWKRRTCERSDRLLSELLSCHNLKTTFIVMALERGLNIPTIQGITGNSARTIEAYMPPVHTDIHRTFRSAIGQGMARGPAIRNSDRTEGTARDIPLF